MAGVNKVILLGNLGKDPEIVNFENGKKAAFPLATTETHKNRDGQKIEQTEWHNIVCWRGLADVAERFLKKGTQVFVEGKLRTRNWEDKEGNKKYITEIVAENFMILSHKNYGGDGGQNTLNDVDTLESILNSTTEPLQDLPF